LKLKLTLSDKTAELDEPCLGFFWVLPVNDHKEEFALAAVIAPVSQIPVIGGFRTVDQGHVDIWPLLCATLPHLTEYEYEDFPRGRVNWRASDDRFLLLMDRKLFRPIVERSLMTRFALPDDKTLTMQDSHYVSGQSLRGRFVSGFAQ
jgi:hypothetical protein